MRRFLAFFCQVVDFRWYFHVKTTISKNYPQGLPSKFQGATFVAIKISGNEILYGVYIKSEPDLTTFSHIDEVLRVWRIWLSNSIGAFGFIRRCKVEVRLLNDYFVRNPQGAVLTRRPPHVSISKFFVTKICQTGTRLPGIRKKDNATVRVNLYS